MVGQSVEDVDSICFGDDVGRLVQGELDGRHDAEEGEQTAGDQSGQHGRREAMNSDCGLRRSRTPDCDFRMPGTSQMPAQMTTDQPPTRT